MPVMVRSTTNAKAVRWSQEVIGDFSPKLVELTDRVLFDDVWERKE